MDDASAAPAPRSPAGGRPIELKIEYRRLNAFFADYLKNISRGTTVIRSARTLPVGTEFLFQLQVPTLQQPLRLHGVVADLLPPGTDGAPDGGMGITFLYRHGAGRDEVARVVERLMAESLGTRLAVRLARASGDRPGEAAPGAGHHPVPA
jgi:type IV pilus assembly protein PilZ